MIFSIVRFVLGVPIRFNCESEHILVIIRQIYKDKLSNIEPEITITLNHSRDQNRQLDTPPLFEVNEQDIIGRSGDNYFRADRISLTGIAYLCQRMLHDQYMLRHQVLNTLCFYLLSYRHFLPVHACCFRLNNQLVLCIGRSGVGKSTLAMAAKQHGLAVLSEDLCFVSPDERYGIKADCREFHLYPDSYKRFKEINNSKVSLTHNGKHKHIIPNNTVLNPAIAAELTGQDIIVLFLSARHAQKESEFKNVVGEDNFEWLLYPNEEGFKLFSDARESAINWLRSMSAISVNMGYCFTDFFTRLEEEQNNLKCAIL